MTEAQAKHLLDRELMDKFVAEKLSPTLTLLRELVDYGVGLIHRCVQRPGGSLADLVITGHFLKHGVMMLDGVEIQLSRGAVSQASVSARSLLETYIYLMWLLKEDTESRGRQFYVWHLRQKRVWTRRVIPGTAEHGKFHKVRATVASLSGGDKAEFCEREARKQDAEIERILSNAENRPINDAFEDKLKKRDYDVQWYQINNGPNSVRGMARELHLDVEYDVFYSQFSDVSHAAAFDKNVRFRNGVVILEPVRNPEELKTVVNFAGTLAFRVFRLIITKYFPQDIQVYNLTYWNEWRERFMSVPEVVINCPANDKGVLPVSPMTP